MYIHEAAVKDTVTEPQCTFLSDISSPNNPQVRASLEYLTINIQSVSPQ